jgi:hypothetical protein
MLSRECVCLAVLVDVATFASRNQQAYHPSFPLLSPHSHFVEHMLGEASSSTMDEQRASGASGRGEAKKRRSSGHQSLD